MSTSTVDQVLAAAGVRFAYLFGSRATGRHRPASDADIAIMSGRPLDLLAEAGLADHLAQVLRVPAADLVQTVHHDHWPNSARTSLGHEFQLRDFPLVPDLD